MQFVILIVMYSHTVYVKSFDGEKFHGFIHSYSESFITKYLYIVNYNRGFLANANILTRTVFSSYNHETFCPRNFSRIWYVIYTYVTDLFSSTFDIESSRDDSESDCT